MSTVCLALASATAAADAKPKMVTSIGPIVGGEDGMVVSSNNDAARVGAAILADGGNAIDAAVAMQFALGVAEPGYSGIGGGGFMMIYDADTKSVTVIDSRERAPAKAKANMFLQPDGEPVPFDLRRTLGVAVGVPGVLAGLQAALDKFGTRSLATLIEPSIALAEQGVVVTNLLAESLDEHGAILTENPTASAVFFPDGEPLRIGDLLVQPDLAETMKTLADDGIDAFYRGEIGEAFVAEVEAAGGKMTLADLKNYEVTFDEPLTGRYGDYEIVTTAPPSSGGITVLQFLDLLETVDIGNYAVGSSTRYHLVMKAMQLAFADRNAYLGDPEFIPLDLGAWLDPKYIAKRAALIELDDNTCPLPPGNLGDMAPAPDLVDDVRADPQTTHLNVADRWGNLVSFTTSIEQHYGTGRMLPGYGFFLNNQLTDFDPLPGRPNSPAPDKRPLSSMSPTLVFRDGAPVYVLGSPGGPRIIAAVAQVLLNLLEYGLEPEPAVALPRVFSDLCSRKARWEPGLPAAVRTRLKQWGHSLRDDPEEVGDVGVIRLEDGTFVGVADPRRNGVAVGLTRTE
ncbi:gamma-glutamyltransferase [Nannocystis radixulma]|uniref:Glutathione hydrolase proenzyme n=1 Tax=Nannocystis radixulma TaxID=2995305 RepID=A0ABT5B680_9BACT|nr:gamma-glutamyltransferase [Nannocystis radixulma]MDC0669228.1 gamma-glutamyltransferase [Nannocystis radixulma]